MYLFETANYSVLFIIFSYILEFKFDAKLAIFNFFFRIARITLLLLYIYFQFHNVRYDGEKNTSASSRGS